MPDKNILISGLNGIDHVAYACRDSDKTIGFLGCLGFRVAIYRRHISKFNIYASKLTNEKGDVIELVEPIEGEISPVNRLLENAECVLYHVSYKIDDFDQTRKNLIDQGAITVTKPFESYLFEGYMDSHLYHPSLGLFEIFGKKK